jgi:hypothetical protein
MTERSDNEKLQPELQDGFSEMNDRITKIEDMMELLSEDIQEVLEEVRKDRKAVLE